MKYLKTFEKSKEKEDTILYKNKDFTIIINNKNDNMTYYTNYRSCSPIYGMIDQIREKSIFLNDTELRRIKLTGYEKSFAMLSLDPQYFKNKLKYHSSVINGFIGDASKVEVSKLPDKVYSELSEFYLPLIEDVIKKSETIGDIIDSFKILYDDITEKLPMYIIGSKFNL